MKGRVMINRNLQDKRVSCAHGDMKILLNSGETTDFRKMLEDNRTHKAQSTPYGKLLQNLRKESRKL